MRIAGSAREQLGGSTASSSSSPRACVQPAAWLHAAQFIDDGNGQWEITHHKTGMWQSQKAGHSALGMQH